MSDSTDDKSSSDGAKVTEVSHETKGGIVTEDSDEISRNNHPAIEVGQESFGAPPDNEVEYVKGYPVIRSGKWSLRLGLAIIANDSAQVPMSPNLLYRLEMMEIHP